MILGRSMKLRIDENDQIVVEPWGSDEEAELRSLAADGVHLDVVRARFIKETKGVEDSPSST